MEEVVHQHHRTLEGTDHTNLAFQRRIAGICLDAKGLEVRGKDFVCMNGLGDSVGHSVATENFAEGHAHQRPQDPGVGGLRRYAIELRNFPHQAVIDDLRVEGEHQRARIEASDGPLELGVGRPHGGEDLTIGGEGLLEGGENVLHQCHWRTHVHNQQRVAADGLRLDKALALQ